MFKIKVCSIRGAITSNNTREDIINDTKTLLEAIIKGNNLDIQNIISIIFSCTKDLNTAYPAVAARQMNITEASLFCTQEMYVEDSLEKCIRVMLLFNSEKEQSDSKHIYLKKATILRPDLLNKN